MHKIIQQDLRKIFYTKAKVKGQKFKGFWHSIMKRFQSKLGFDKNEHYTYVTDDLYNNGVFDKHEKEIATDYSKKVKTLDDINNLKDKRKKDNDFKGV